MNQPGVRAAHSNTCLPRNAGCRFFEHGCQFVELKPNQSIAMAVAWCSVGVQAVPASGSDEGRCVYRTTHPVRDALLVLAARLLK